MTKQSVNASDLSVEYVPLDTLLRWPNNSKLHDLGAIAASIEKYGFRDPIGVNVRNNYIEEGHGRLDTLQYFKRQGRPVPRFIRVDEQGNWLVPILFFDDDEMTQKAYSIAHNRTHDLGGGYDEEKLLETLLEQANSGGLIGTGYDGDDVDALRARLEAAAVEPEPPVRTQFSIVIACNDEPHQLELLERFIEEGLKARPQTK
jgi:hypothetical protein